MGIGLGDLRGIGEERRLRITLRRWEIRGDLDELEKVGRTIREWEMGRGL